MKTLFMAALLFTSSFSLSSCTTFQQETFQGRIHTFKSDGQGFDTQTYFYESSEEVIAFDSQFTPELARQSINYLRRFTKKPISHLVITHPNPDKFNGASEFKKEGAIIVASEATQQALEGVHQYKKYYFVEIAKMFSNENYPTLTKVDETFQTDLTIRLSNGEQILLKEYEQKGVSSNQTIAILPREQGLVVGDLIHHKAHAWLEGGIQNGVASPDIASWVSLIETIKDEFPNELLVYAGRGELGQLGEVVAAQKNYLVVAEQKVQEYLDQLTDPSVVTGDQANAHYQNISDLISSSFPDYQLNYMINYGVYGLVNSKL